MEDLHLPGWWVFPVSASKSRWPEESQMERPSARVDAAFGREFFQKNTRWLVTPTVRIHAGKDHWISVMLCHEIGNDNIDESSVMTYHRVSYDSTKWKLKCQYRFLAYIRHVRICPRYRRSHAAALDYIRYYELSKRVSLKCWMFISNCVNGLYMLLVSWRT